jgi:hypothetical protein
MDFLDFSDVSFPQTSSIGHLFENLNTIIGQGIWYDTSQVQNTKWLWLVTDLVTTLNNDNVLCGTFGLYPSYFAGIINSVEEINFYVLCNKHISYGKHIRNCIAGKECTFKLLAKNSFLLTSGCDTVLLFFEARLILGRLPPRQIFAQGVLRKMRLSSLFYGIVCIKNCLTYITNNVLTSKHESKFDMFALDLFRP